MLYKDLYRVASRLMLRSAPDPRAWLQGSFEVSISPVTVDSVEHAQCLWEPIPERGSNHWEGVILLSSCVGKKDDECAPLSRVERAAIWCSHLWHTLYQANSLRIYMSWEFVVFSCELLCSWWRVVEWMHLFNRMFSNSQNPLSLLTVIWLEQSLVEPQKHLSRV